MVEDKLTYKDSYRDGGTEKYLYGTTNESIALWRDFRIGTSTPGSWWRKYPGNNCTDMIIDVTFTSILNNAISSDITKLRYRDR